MCPPLSPISVSITNHLGFGIYNSAVKIHFLCKSWYTFPFPNLKKKKSVSGGRQERMWDERRGKAIRLRILTLGRLNQLVWGICCNSDPSSHSIPWRTIGRWSAGWTRGPGQMGARYWPPAAADLPGSSYLILLLSPEASCTAGNWTNGK